MVRKKRKKPGEKSELKRKHTEVKSDNRNRQEENKNRPNGGENGDKTRRKKGRTREEKGGWGEGSKLIVEWIAAAAVVEIDGVVSRPEAQRRAGPRRGRGTKKKASSLFLPHLLRRSTGSSRSRAGSA